MMLRSTSLLILALAVALLLTLGTTSAQRARRTRPPYYGVRIGDLDSQNGKNLSGTVYAINNKQLFIKGFTYDGTGPDVFFYVGTFGSPRDDSPGTIIPDENNSFEKLGVYQDEDIVLNLPDEIDMTSLRWLSVWCRQFDVDFATLEVPSTFEPPRPFTTSSFPRKRFNHNTYSGNITFLNEKTIMIEDFHYDGSAPDAYFLVGTRGRPNGRTGIKVPDENRSLEPIGAYNGQTVVLTLPGDMRVRDVRWFSVYCIQFAEDFNHIALPPRTIPHNRLPSSMGFLVSYWWYYLAYGFYPGYWSE